MKLITTFSERDTASIDIDVASANQGRPINHLKLFVSGNLAVGGGQYRILIRVDRKAAGYRSFVRFDGDPDNAIREFDQTGFYAGRNGNFVDATISLEYTLDAASTNYITGNGLATYYHGSNWLHGCECHGGLIRNQAISTLQVVVVDEGTKAGTGLFTGEGRVYAL